MHIGSKRLLFALVLVLIAGQLHAATFNGRLVRVLGGDTVEVVREGVIEPVRLSQIYAPIWDQPYGTAAKEFVSRVAADEEVTVHFEERDLHGRLYGEVFLLDGTNLNKLIVGSGYAWRYEGFTTDPDYADLEKGARQAKKGLWGVDVAVPPWEWRWVQAQASIMRDSESSDSGYVCGKKTKCYEMSSCQEAKFYFYACGLSRLDRDGNGIPCDARCQ